ncbi:MAG: carboxypeptidase regulatory-like domain-containing protein [Acidobacteria bacterium]|nr:carboxypeptidase regulatory-like domain-containing protein [Acidobacteriota bacterium]
MNGLSDTDLERLLQVRPAPRPPARLGELIKAEIPPHISVGAGPAVRDANGDDPVDTWGLSGRVAVLAAAAVVVAAAVGVLGVLPGGTVEERPVQRVLLAAGEDDRAAICVVSAADPTAAEAASRRLVAIEVAVLGPDEAPRSGARVAVEPVGAAGSAFLMTTDRRGRAQTAGLPPGTYRVRCTPAAGVAAGDEVTLQAGEAAALLLLLPAEAIRVTPVA